MILSPTEKALIELANKMAQELLQRARMAAMSEMTRAISAIEESRDIEPGSLEPEIDDKGIIVGLTEKEKPSKPREKSRQSQGNGPRSKQG
jgi:hypothetical protein